jgi:branched-chain amino acid transport system permease protein
MQETVQQVVNALSLGSIYALIALGVAIVFSIMGLINFAHGELITVAGYTMLFLFGRGVPFVLVVPLAILAAVCAAVVLERVAFRPLRGSPPLTLLLTSFAASLIIQNTLLLFGGARPKGLDFPAIVDDSFEIASIPIQWLDVVILATTVVALVALTQFLRRSVAGLAMRSAAEDFATTRLMGVRANRVVVVAFVVSGALAGLAAVFYFAATPAVEPTSGFLPLLKGFIAAVIGGLGSLSGAVLGGFLLAGLEVAIEALLPGSLNAYVDAFVFAIVIAVLLFRPSGILGSREAESRV